MTAGTGGTQRVRCPQTAMSETPSETCNIGSAELRRRRDAAMAATAALAAAVLAVVTGVIPSWTAPYLAPLASAAVVTGLQVRLRFCVAFGMSGLVGMGNRPGSSAAAPALRAAHRRRAALMLAAGACAMLAWVVVTGWLVLNLG